jgi:hypothetical protein
MLLKIKKYNTAINNSVSCRQSNGKEAAAATTAFALNPDKLV